MRKTVFFVSDSTGITAETIGHSILAQFDGVHFDTHRLPFVNDADKAAAAALRIKTHYAKSGQKPIVINTLADRAMCDIVANSGALMLDVFAPFVGTLENELGIKRSGAINRSHGLVNYAEYESRINATNYTLAHDDGVNVHYDDADVVLIGVSRSGKTPTCLYMALQYGVRAANYPLTDDDLDKLELPVRLQPYRDRLYGLTIDADRLSQIRSERRPDSRYASLEQCRQELKQADRLYRMENIPCISTTHTSIEEIASKILDHFSIDKNMF
ncbi:MAG TPA: pyruvate, water dikinase regulatory protein [Rhodanobacteraceae bacterium]|nr:pyruvate, water dikinase regulatory protein [Rhodanobacteraceae bacterium]